MKLNTRGAMFNKWILIRILLFITIILHVYTLLQWISPVYESGKLFISFRWKFLFLSLSLGIILEILILGICWTQKKHILEQAFHQLTAWLRIIRGGNLILFAIIVISFPVLIFGRFGYYFNTILLHLTLLWTILIFGSLVLFAWDSTHSRDSKRFWIEFPALTLVSASTAYLFGSYSAEINSYPFSLYWSETSRFYYASLFTSEKVYGASYHPSVLHPSRYLMQSIPFLFSNTTLLVHRAWQVFLWMITTLLTAYSLAGRIYISDELRRWIFILWTILFLLIGPVYYHLQIPVLIIFLAFNRPGIFPDWVRHTISIAGLLIASAWAGISRVNWFPVPGILAASLIFLEIPLTIPATDSTYQNNQKSAASWRYKATQNYVFLALTVIIIGTLTAYASQATYIAVSGNEKELFASSFSSHLYWYRLLPNPTYPLGILPAILLVTLPFFLIMYARLFSEQNGMTLFAMLHPVRLLGLGLFLLVLFLGGIVVSTKIGGGSNLHNLDAYLVLLLLISAYFFFERIKPDAEPFSNKIYLADGNTNPPSKHIPNAKNNNRIEKVFRLGLVMALIIPVLSALTASGLRFKGPDQATIDRYFQKIDELVEAAKKRGGEILFITDRHLLTFHYIEDIPLVPEYEKVFLMEMAMSANKNYLDKFKEDLKNHRFSLIISEPLYFKNKGRSERFGEENDIWIERVARHLECNYMEERTLPEVNIQLLIPNRSNQDCE